MDWYPFFPRRYRSATRHLCPFQDGLYRRLIDEYMDTEEALPDNDLALARICSISPQEFAPHVEVIRMFFTPKNGHLFHDFCDTQLRVRKQHQKRRIEKAKNAAKIRHEKNKEKQEVGCYEQTPSNAQGMLGIATGQDRTGQKKESKKEPPSPIEPPATQKTIAVPTPALMEIDQHFPAVWSAFKGFGKNGARGEGFKGRRAAGLEKFREIYIETKGEKREKLIRNIISGCLVYADFLERTGSPGQTFANWLAARGWEDDYSTTSETNAGGNGRYSLDDVMQKVNADVSTGKHGRAERVARFGLSDIAGDEE